eukprot:1142179-Pelagomonas_calceolata.AAC.2
MAWQLNFDASDLDFCLVKPKSMRVLTCWAVAASRVEKGSVRAESRFDKVVGRVFFANVTFFSFLLASRSNISRIKVGRLARDRAHKHSFWAALVPGRGASIIREKPVRGSSGYIFRVLSLDPGVSHSSRHPY